MLTKEFYDIEKENVKTDLYIYWGIQTDSETKKRYISVPFPTKEEFIDRFITGINDPYEDLEDYEDNLEEWEKLEEEYIKEIAETYDKIKSIREDFSKKNNYEII